MKETDDLPGQEAYSFVITLDSTLLIKLKVGPTKGKNSTNVRSFLSVSSLLGG
jgi:hypothetical protein